MRKKMLKINIQISIITLTKNNNLKFLRTLKSINKQEHKSNIEWIIIDGSNKKKYLKNKKYIKNNLSNQESIFIKHINSKEININGIYPCMNYGKKISNGKFIIFLNSGDTFYNKKSLKLFFNSSLNITNQFGLIFGQAKIIAARKINWYFPGSRLSNINKWLKFFEPNHQSMLISRTLANRFDFSSKYNIIGDGYWKRKIIENADKVIYIKSPVIKFFLDGVSSAKPSKRMLKDLIFNKDISIIRKIIFFIKFIFPSKVFFFYYLLQKFKCYLIDLII